MNSYSSKLIDDAVREITKLPGIGSKTALRLALHLLRQDMEEVEALGNSIIKLRREIRFCRECNNISDSEVCEICSDTDRDRQIVCVVEDIRDVIAIENTRQYKGIYHVLGGIISPMDGITAGDLNIDSLITKVDSGKYNEVILALSTTIEGDTTNFYLFKILKDKGVNITTIARGIAVGDELEYTDEVTLGRSIINRTPYEKSMNNTNH